MADLVILQKQLTASSAASIAALQSAAAGASLTLASTPVTLDTQRRVQITCSGNETSNAFTVTGTMQGGGSISEKVTGVSSGTAVTVQDFLSVTSIVTSATTSTAGVTVGTNATGSTPWQLFNNHITPPSLGFLFEVPSGTVTATVETTNDSILPPLPIYSNAGRSIPVALPLQSMANMTSTVGGAIDYPVRGWRLTVSSGTGAAQCTGIQAGIRN